MEIELLDDILEALLFVAGDGLKIDDIVSLLELQKREINESVKRLKAKYSGKCGIHLLTFNGKIQFGSNPEYADIVACVLNPLKEKELTNATLETVAIIAYKQPVTRLEVEQIRGVNCDYAIQMLLKHNLIEIVGRKDAVGKPLLFGTTDNFLKRFRLSSIEELPDYAQLLDNIKVLEAAGGQTPGLYHEFEIAEEEPPEFLAGENLDKIE